VSRGPAFPDSELGERIRRAVQHYRAERSLPVVRRMPRRSLSRAVLPVSAVVAGGVAAIVAIGILQPIGGSRPAIDRAALNVCRPERQRPTIPEDWLEPNETRAAIVEALRDLPLAAKFEDRGLVVYLFSDGRFGATCLTTGNDEGSLGPFAFDVRTMLLDVPDEAIRVAGWTADPEGPVITAGIAGDGVDSVEVARSDGERIPAMLAGGVWLAWWPERVNGMSVEAFDAQGQLVAREEETITVPPPAPQVPGEVARERCLIDEEIPEEWRLPGEDFGEAQERLQGLPLLIVHHGTATSTFLFGDETYWVHCTVDRLADGQTGSSGPRSDEGGPIVVRSGSSTAQWELPERVIAGEASPEATRVSVELSDGARIDAQVAGGYWMAWWESDAEARTVRAYDARGNELGSTSVPGP
jgi:hypothetical protein